MILCVDIGNTYTKLKSGNSRLFRIETAKIKDVNSLKELFPKELKYDAACISSVSYGKSEIFTEYFDSLNIKSLNIDASLKYEIEYPKVNELGADLMSLMEGALEYSDTFIAVSLGTASVFLYVENRKFGGCAIAPGLLSSMDGLINTASLIENTSLNGEYELLGFNTESSVRDGLMMGHTFMIDGYLNAIKEENKLENPTILLMGGFSETLMKKLKNKVIIDQDLIFKGMNRIYKNN